MARPLYVYDDEFELALDNERRYQRRKWGEHELSHDTVEWTAILAMKLGDLSRVALGAPATTERDTVKAQLVQIAAVAKAAYASVSIVEEVSPIEPWELTDEEVVMDKILLTRDDIQKVYDKAWPEWCAGPREKCWLDYWEEAICRAQLRKVVEWWDQWRCGSNEENPCQYVGYDQNICEACKAQALILALRAAVEGK